MIMKERVERRVASSLRSSAQDRERQKEEEEGEVDGFGNYLRAIGERPLLTREKGIRLVKEVEEGGFVERLRGSDRDKSQNDLNLIGLKVESYLRGPSYETLKVTLSHFGFATLDEAIDKDVYNKVVLEFGKRSGQNGTGNHKNPKQIVRDISVAEHLLQGKARFSQEDGDTVFWEKYLAEVEKKGKEAKGELIEANLRLVVFVAKKFAGRGVDLEDLVQEGNRSILERAVDLFDYRFGYKLSTYLGRVIWDYCSKSAAEGNKPVALTRYDAEVVVRRIVKIRDDFFQKHHREPTVPEITQALGREKIKEAEVLGILLTVFSSVFSLEAHLLPNNSDKISYPLSEAIASQDDGPEELAVKNHLREKVRDLFWKQGVLNDRERQVLALRFGLWDGECHTLEETGKQIGCTREWVRILEGRGMGKLQAHGAELKVLLEDHRSE